MLDAKAAAGIRRGAQAETIARNFERARHHCMQAERPHEVRQHIVCVLGGIVFGKQAVGFDRGAGVARIADGHRDAPGSVGESALAIAVTEGAFARDVGMQTLVQDRLRGVERGERVDNRGQQIVIDLDKVERVLSGVAAARDNDRHRLANIANAVNGNRPALDRRFHADDQAGGQGGDILTDEHSRHPGRFAARPRCGWRRSVHGHGASAGSQRAGCRA